MTEPTATPPAVSPTGAPLLPPRIAQWLSVAVVAALAGLGTATALYPESRPLQIALAVVTALAAVLGIASPGLRRPVSMLLLVLSVGSMSGCATIKAWWGRSEPRVIDCMSSSVKQALPSVAGDVVEAMRSPGDPGPRLEGLRDRVAAKGQTALLDALACAVVAMIGEMSAGDGHVSSAMPMPPSDEQVKAKQASAWVRAQGWQFHSATDQP